MISTLRIVFAFGAMTFVLIAQWEIVMGYMYKEWERSKVAGGFSTFSVVCSLIILILEGVEKWIQ